jgi:hypothetical protein
VLTVHIVLTAFALLHAQGDNRFAAKYNIWAAIRNTTPAGTINAKEIAAWQDVKREWRRFSKSIDIHYEGR